MPHKQRTVCASGLLAGQLSGLQCDALPSQAHEAQVLGQIQHHTAATRHVQLDWNPLIGNPSDRNFGRRYPQQFLAHFDARTRRITLNFDPVRTPSKQQTNQAKKTKQRHPPHCSASGQTIPMFCMRHPFLITLFAAALSCPSAVAAPQKKQKQFRAKDIKQERSEIALLQRSTELYWDGVRWNNPEKSSAFIEDATNRMQFQQWLEERFKNHRVLDARVLRVDVGPPLAKEAREVRKAKTSVAVEGYTIPDQVVKNETVLQMWYRSPTGWWLEWSPDSTKQEEEQ